MLKINNSIVHGEVSHKFLNMKQISNIFNTSNIENDDSPTMGDISSPTLNFLERTFIFGDMSKVIAPM